MRSSPFRNGRSAAMSWAQSSRRARTAAGAVSAKPRVALASMPFSSAARRLLGIPSASSFARRRFSDAESDMARTAPAAGRRRSRTAATPASESAAPSSAYPTRIFASADISPAISEKRRHARRSNDSAGHMAASAPHSSSDSIARAAASPSRKTRSSSARTRAGEMRAMNGVESSVHRRVSSVGRRERRAQYRAARMMRVASSRKLRG